MFRIVALLFAMSATSALADETVDRIFNDIERHSQERDARNERRLDEELRAAREYDQRERLSDDQNRALNGIETQLRILNQNTIPRY